jgi:hypothetical protein
VLDRAVVHVRRDHKRVGDRRYVRVGSIAQRAAFPSQVNAATTVSIRADTIRRPLDAGPHMRKPISAAAGRGSEASQRPRPRPHPSS